MGSIRTRWAVGWVLLSLCALPPDVWGRPDPIDAEGLRAISDAATTEAAADATGFRSARPAAIPDIFGPGAVLTVGNLIMKITNFGVIGNPFLNLSSDPSAQWPSTSGVEYLQFLLLAVGGVNPTATDPSAIRRVSYLPDWRPPTPDPEDRMYRAYDGIINGARFANDDGDLDPITQGPRIDEDFLDGRDNDGDGRIDEDYAALGQLMYSCVMRDDTPAALANVGNEKHVPLVVECRQLAWAYSVPGFQDFNAIEYTIYNRSGHTLDSMYFGFRVDIDSGPLVNTSYFTDDQDLPSFPSGAFQLEVPSDDPRYQATLSPAGATVPLCAERTIHVNGTSVVDNDGDESSTPGVATFLLLGHTTDPLGVRAPSNVAFRSFRSHIAGTPYASNGNPSIDQQRFEMMSSTQSIDRETGLINAEPGDQAGDYQLWTSVGPFLQVPDGGSIQATVAFAVARGAFRTLVDYRADYERFRNGFLTQDQMFEKYPALANAFTAQVAYEGVYEEPRTGFEEQVPDCHGCETGIKLPTGTTPQYIAEQCPDRETVTKQVTDNAYTWFDLDCDMCTGVYDEFERRGYFLRHWNAESPPPSPNMNVTSTYNYSDNPNRVVAAGDNQVILAWDNISENTPDPKSGWFDFRSYRIWKVAGWRRPVGAAGPNDEDWSLLGEFRLFEHDHPNTGVPVDSNFTDPADCPKVFVPSYEYPAGHPHCDETGSSTLTKLSYGGCRDTATVGMCLRRGDLWNRQSGQIIRPDLTVDCARDTTPAQECITDRGYKLGDNETTIEKVRYRVGRYRFVDREVKNGFVYFYSVTAGDSTSGGELFGRRSAVEADAVVPQASTVASDKGVWVVPNPYRGFTNITDRPSAWDLTPNATDPTGTHVDFYGLPSGDWTIRIFTVSGDLVAEIRSEDPVNESVRSVATDESGVIRPGYNRQQDNPNDGQARWNLISRNGQDVVSGIYVFVVESDQGQQRGKFVIIR
jgi:hypothetical protein